MLVTSQEQVCDIADYAAQFPEVAVDTETTGLNLYLDDYMLGMSLSYGVFDWYIPVAHVGGENFLVDELCEALANHPGRLIFHNAEFDWTVIRKETGIDLSTHEFWDTQTVDWLLDENLPHGLKVIGSRLWGTDAAAEQKALRAIFRGRTQADIYKELRATDEWKARPAKEAKAEAVRLAPLTKKTWATLTAEDVGDYAAQDTRLTLDLYHHQVHEVRVADPPLYDTTLMREFQVQRVLHDMMTAGVRIDPVAAEAAAAQCRQMMASIEPEFMGVNLNSPKQLAKLIYEEWGAPVRKASRKTGAPSTDRATLEELAESHPKVEKLVEYRKLQKALGTYFEPLLSKRDANDRVHTHFNAHRTVTGRLSSSDPNLQNIPKDSTNAAVRAIFIPGDGLELWEYDLKAAEMRVMAGWSKDENLIGAVMNPDVDIHLETALSIWGPEVVLESKESIEQYRTLAKNVGYGYPYGIGGEKIANYIVKGTGQPVTPGYIAQGHSIKARYEKTYPGLARLMHGVQRHVDQYHVIPLHVPGRYRRYKGPGYTIWETYTALNSIVQGGIGEFMKDVMLEASTSPAHGHEWRMVLQVHDSLVCEVAPGMSQYVLDTLNGIAGRINPFDLPMEFDAKQRGA